MIVIYCEGTRDGVYVEVAMQHNDSYTEGSYSFVNNIINAGRRYPSDRFQECIDEDV